MGPIRSVVRDWVPPVALQLRNRLRKESRVFGTHQEALAFCGDGYDADFIAEAVVAKTMTLRDALGSGPVALDLGAFRTLVAMGYAGSAQPLRVLDFGGAAGYHYFIARATAAHDRNLDWRVVETPAMVQAAAGLATADELSFFTSSMDATSSWEDPPDLIIASAVLHYVPDPLGTLVELLQLGARRVFVTRTGLSPDGITRVIVQQSPLASNGPGPLPAGYPNRSVAYPAAFVPVTEFENAIETSQYRIFARVSEDADAWHAGGVRINQYGYLCEPR